MNIDPTKITYEYIRGVIEGEGSFSFSTNYSKARKVPSFQLRMHVRDLKLIEQIRDTLKLSNRIYIYHYSPSPYNRGPQVMLIVREFGALKNIIIPLCHKRLKGYKGLQFEEWIHKIGRDPMVSEKFKLLYKFYEWGVYDRVSSQFE